MLRKMRLRSREHGPSARAATHRINFLKLRFKRRSSVTRSFLRALTVYYCENSNADYNDR